MYRGFVFLALWLLFVPGISACEQYDQIVNSVFLRYVDPLTKEERKIQNSYTIFTQPPAGKERIALFREDPLGDTVVDLNGTLAVLSQTDQFRPDEKIFIIATLSKSTATPKKRISVLLHSQDDRESLVLKKTVTDKNQMEYIATIRTSRSPKHKRHHDNVLYVRQRDRLIVYPVRSKQNRILSSVSATIGQPLGASASPEGFKIWLTQPKTRYTMEAGEIQKAEIKIENRSGSTLHNLQLQFHLPPQIALLSNPVGRKLHFRHDKKTDRYLLKIPSIKSHEKLIIPYLFQANISFQKRRKGKISLLRRGEILSNIVDLNFQIEKDSTVNPDGALIMGRIYGLDEQRGRPVQIYLDSGKVATIDKKGRFHFQNISAGTHIVQLDEESLPGGYRLAECTKNRSYTSDTGSAIVTLLPGMAKNISFCVKKISDDPHSHPHKKSRKNEKYSAMPEYSVADLASYKAEKYLWLWPPKDDFVPDIGSVKVAILHPRNETVKLFLNDRQVDMLNFDGTISSSGYSGAIDKYLGIDILEGDNYFEARIYDKSGRLKHTLKRKIHLSSAPYTVHFLEKQSSLIADGKKAPVITLQLFDQYGYPVRKSMQGRCSVEPPFQFYRQPDKHLAKAYEHQTNYSVGENGLVHIRLEPTTITSDVKLHIELQNRDETVVVPMHPGRRKWILVGFAEGSIAYSRIKNHLQKTNRHEMISHGRTSLFAKGTIFGETLLTIAFDSGKSKDLEIFERIDPKSQYTIYQDESIQSNETPSQKKFYIKLENRTFKILFGDMHTGVNGCEIINYDRKLNGLKAEYRNQSFKAILFASDTATEAVKDEITPDGTNGIYRLSHHNIVQNSESLFIVVRDRYHKQKIIRKRELTPLLDYTVDYVSGKIYLKTPLFAYTPDNQPQYLEVNYEISSNGTKTALWGARLRLRTSIESMAVASLMCMSHWRVLPVLMLMCISPKMLRYVPK